MAAYCWRSVNNVMMVAIVHRVLSFIDYNDNFRNVFEGTSSKLEDIALAFYLIMYSYDGW